MGPNAKSFETRLLQALAFALGAAALYVLIEKGSTKFYFTPLIIGLSYLAAAAVGGRNGGHWPTAMVLLGWGAVVVYAGESRPDLDTAGLYLAGGGAGVLLAGILIRLGFVIDVIGLGGAALAAGLILAFSGRVDQFVEAKWFALVLAIVAIVNLVLAFVARGKGTRGPRVA